jgi:imidazolonepropionase-like amidohydrolase
VTVISGGTALIGEGLETIEDASIVIRDGVIETAGTDPTDGDIDARGLTLIPGFIDSHVHIGFYPPASVLRGGVTTVRDLAWPPEVIFPLAARSEDPGFDGPRIVAAGPMLTVPGGYPTRAGWAPEGTGMIVDPGDPGAAVTAVSDSGATVVKVGLNAQVGPTLDLATLRSIVEAAHERGLKVTGHVYGLDELRKAIEAGMDELAHMLMSPERIPDETLAAMVAAEMAVVPTLSIRFGRDRRIAIDNLRRFVEAGGRVVYGTDLGNGGPKPGIDAREVKAMAAAGLDGRAILRSGTVDAAAWLEMDGTGVISPGMAADIVGVAGDPVSDPKALTEVRLVMRAGRVIRAP